MKRFLTVLIALLCVTAVFASEAFADNSLDYSVSGGVVDLDGIRHDDDSAIPSDCSYQSQSYALITAGRLYYNGIFIYKTLCFCIANHIVGGTGFD